MWNTKTGGLTAWQVKTMSHKAQEHSETSNCTSPAVKGGLSGAGEGKSGTSCSHPVGPWSKVFPEPHLWYKDLLTCHEPGSQPGSRRQAGQPRTVRCPRSLPSSPFFLAEALGPESQMLFQHDRVTASGFCVCPTVHPPPLSQPKGAATRALSTLFIEETSAGIKGGSWVRG